MANVCPVKCCRRSGCTPCEASSLDQTIQNDTAQFEQELDQYMHANPGTSNGTLEEMIQQQEDQLQQDEAAAEKDTALLEAKSRAKWGSPPSSCDNGHACSSSNCNAILHDPFGGFKCCCPCNSHCGEQQSGQLHLEQASAGALTDTFSSEKGGCHCPSCPGWAMAIHITACCVQKGLCEEQEGSLTSLLAAANEHNIDPLLYAANFSAEKTHSSDAVISLLQGSATQNAHTMSGNGWACS